MQQDLFRLLNSVTLDILHYSPILWWQIIQGVFLFTDYKTLLIPLSLDQATVYSPGAPNFDSGLSLYSHYHLYDWRLKEIWRAISYSFHKYIFDIFVCVVIIFSGRCQNEAFAASEDIKRNEPNFNRLV